MDFVERHDRLAKMALLIRLENTGNPHEFAKKCNLNSVDALFDQIDILRQLTGRESAKILYDKYRRTYYFYPKGKFRDFKFIEDD
jgi:hypothetical protein